MIKKIRLTVTGLALVAVVAVACEDGDKAVPRNETPGTTYEYKFSGRYAGSGVIRDKKTLVGNWHVGDKKGDYNVKNDSRSWSHSVKLTERKRASLTVWGGRGGGKVECKITVFRNGREVDRVVKTVQTGRVSCSV